MRYKEPYAASATGAKFQEKILPRTTKFRVADGIALAAAAGLMLTFIVWEHLQLASNLGHVWRALAITAAFTAVAWLAGEVESTGAAAGAAISFVFAARDLRFFCMLLIVFATTLLATRIGRKRKEALQAGEASNSRSASQIIANLGLAGLLIALAVETWQVLAIAALAEAACDTCSSEIGMAFPGKTVLLTTWKRVPPGVDGGISFMGTCAGVAGAVVVALCSVLLGLFPYSYALLAFAAGFLGMLVDSLLGAVAERRGWLNNDTVNLLGTAAAIGIAWLMIRL
ncbi:MAG TPA: DUF92 domain-containing protein [Terriglobales bacterium]|nr:DUF92 domain-containing protein [Terriglobales bacterium]